MLERGHAYGHARKPVEAPRGPAHLGPHYWVHQMPGIRGVQNGTSRSEFGHHDQGKVSGLRRGSYVQDICHRTFGGKNSPPVRREEPPTVSHNLFQCNSSEDSSPPLFYYAIV